MNLVTPDSGLIFWMTLAFAIVFFILAKFGFPMISNMVEARKEKIESSLKDADEARRQLDEMEQQHSEMLRKAMDEQAKILSETEKQRNEILDKASADAQKQAETIMENARTRIETEREDAMRQIRSQVASLSVEVAEKVLRDKLTEKDSQESYLDKILDEVEKNS